MNRWNMHEAQYFAFVYNITVTFSINFSILHFVHNRVCVVTVVIVWIQDILNDQLTHFIKWSMYAVNVRTVLELCVGSYVNHYCAISALPAIFVQLWLLQMLMFAIVIIITTSMVTVT